MINPQWLELPMSRTNFHGPKDVRVIEIRLYEVLLFVCSKMADEVVFEAFGNSSLFY